MGILISAILAMLVSWAARFRGKEQLNKFFSFAYLFLLFVWLFLSSNLLSLGRDEEGLLIWVGLGLLFLIIDRLLILLKTGLVFSDLLIFLAALAYAMGLDFLHPDAYGLVPASIVGFMLALLALRILFRLKRVGSGNAIWLIVPFIAVFALLQYAAFYKLFDRNWFLPWSYLMAGGVALFAVSQLWVAWKRFGLSSDTWKRRIQFAFDLGQLLIVVSAFYHYSQYF